MSINQGMQNDMMKFLQQGMRSNPLMSTIFSIAQRGDGKRLEEIARNLAKEKGVDFDTEFVKFKQNYHL